MLSLKPADRVGVFGTTGSGKTEFVKKHVLGELLQRGQRVIALDVKDELSVKGRPRPLTSVGPLPFRYTDAQFAAYPKVINEPGLALAVVPEERTARACAVAFKRIAQMLEAFARDGSNAHTVFLCEETQFWAHYRNDKWRCEEYVDAVATMWRDYNVTLVFVSQRAVGVPIDARAQLNQLVSFAQSEPADIDALRLRTALTDATFSERVAALEPEAHRYELWRAGVKVQTTQHQPTEPDNVERNEGGGNSLEEQPDQDGGRSGGDDLRVPDDQERNGHEEHHLQNRAVAEGPPEVVAAPVDGELTPPSSPVNRSPARSKKKKPAPPPPQPQKTKSRRRRRVAA